MTEKWSRIGAELWLAAQTTAGMLVEIYPRSHGISFLPDRSRRARRPHRRGARGAGGILGHTKADIPRILNWRDPAQAPFGVRRPINTSELQWDAAVFCLRHFLDGGWAPIPSNPAEGSTNFSRCRERGGASMNAASVCSSMKPGRRGDHPGQSPSSWCGAPGCVSMAPRWSR